MKRKLPAWILIVTISWFYSCDSDSDPKINPDGEMIKLSNHATLGSILTDGDGVTLYFFTRDANGESACEGGCLDLWPIFYAEDPELDAGLNSTDFGTVMHSTGAMQTTYKGWPLYYFAPLADGVGENPGQVAGEAFGNVWFVAKPDYSIMLADAQLVGHDGKNYLDDYTEGDGETQYFTDAFGNTLYRFANDAFETNNFTAPDFSNDGVWPIFYVDPDAVPSTLNESDFGSIMVHGRQQLTYKGWPLYYFGQDAERGDNKGVSFPVPGIWPIVNTATTTAPAPPADPTIMLTEDDALGEILTDGEGRTLYFFSNEGDGASACSGGCLNLWPIFYDEELVIGDGLNPDDFGEITAADGVTYQTTYKGWPLYYFAPAADAVPEAAGETGGDGFNGVWYAAKESYGLMIANGQLVGSDGKNYLDDNTEGTGNTIYFTDAEGRTLYHFSNDSKDTNTFTAPDFSNNGSWPIYYIDLESVPTGMSMDDFGTITVHGEMQTTFKGWPLYYFGGDASRGETKGVSVPVPGTWPIINNDTSPAL